MTALLVTGRPGVGKSTCLGRIASESQHVMEVGGVISGEIRHEGRRAGFEMRLVGVDARTGLLAAPEVEGDIRFGTPRPSDGRPRLGVTHDFLDHVVCPHLERLRGAADLIVLDEIGPMQASSSTFQATVDRLLVGPTPVIASISLHADDWIRGLRDGGALPVVELTKANRDVVTEMLVRQVLEWGSDGKP